MWTRLYQLAAPKKFYSITGRWLPLLTVLTVLFLVIGVVWGLFFAPADYQQGDAFRIIYIHVPCAFLSMALYVWMGISASVLLIWRIKIAGILLVACARMGFCMTLLALITGSLWGKPMWGAFWVWDARLTSELILLFLYGAILAVSNAYQHQDQRDRLVAILTLVGLVDLPIIHYSVYWWNTLHQGATFLTLAKPKIHISMAYPLIFTLLGFSFYCILMVLKNARNDLLLRERLQSWVKDKVACR